MTTYKTIHTELHTNIIHELYLPEKHVDEKMIKQLIEDSFYKSSHLSDDLLLENLAYIRCSENLINMLNGEAVFGLQPIKLEPIHTGTAKVVDSLIHFLFYRDKKKDFRIS